VSASRVCTAAWSAVASPYLTPGSNELNDVDILTSRDAWAVGYSTDATTGEPRTFTEHWEGHSWTIVASPNPSAGLNVLGGVEMIASDDVWAVGAYATSRNIIKTLAMHWNGVTWSVVASPNPGSPPNGSLSGIYALASDDVWAVGGFEGPDGPNRTLIEHWNGMKWSVVASPNQGIYPNGLADVAMISPTDGWAAGAWFTSAEVDQTLLMHWNGVSWTIVSSPNVGTAENDMHGIAWVSGRNVWAVGFHGTKTLVEHWNGTAWKAIPSPTPGSTGIADLSGIAALGAKDSWAVGAYVTDAHVLGTMVQHWDGSAWTVVPSPNVGSSDNRLNAVAAIPGYQWAVGSRFGGGTPRPLIERRCG
jgi:hypothetical protein